MRTPLALLAACSLVLASPGLARAGGGPKLEAGQWEVSVDVSAPGTGVALPSTSQSECLSQADVDADPLPELQKGACRATHITRSGSSIRWDLDCGAQGKGQGEVTYTSSTRYDGTMTLNADGVVVRATIRARRTGSCTPAR